jgi:predicted porin
VGHEIVGSFIFGNTRISAIYERLKYENDDALATAVDEYERDAWFVLVRHKFGANAVWASYGEAEDGDCSRVGGLACSTNGLEGKLFTLGYIYSFSKRTDLFASYFRVENDESQRYGVLFLTPIAPGADTRGIGLGILHSF